MLPIIPPDQLTLGVLAGGRATRLGGVDKAWMQRDGVPQVLRWRRRFAAEASAMLVSANRDFHRYREAGIDAVADRVEGDFGPIAGIEALLAHCRTPWLLTLPVDLVGVNDCLAQTLCAERAPNGAFARDEDGDQPLVALWNVEVALPAAGAAIEGNERAIHALQARLQMPAVHFNGVRFGNLNTPDDLLAAGIRHD
ncbi:molybdenum cofactor guanylyltransferase [Lysobacter tyrosinilyticus]